MIGKIWRVSNFCRNYVIQEQLMKMNSKRKRIVLLQNGETLKNKLKHLLIIFISLLLLSSPVFGDNHKGETLYGWGKCCDYVWKGFGDKETHSKYTGDVKNGKPNGFGILIDPDGIKYVGEWIHRWKNGQGTFTWSDGGEYVGSWKNGTRWNGTFYDKNGNIIYKYVNGR